MPNFRALKITKHYIVNDITQRITTVEREGKKTFAELRGRETQALPRIFTFFWIPPPLPPPPKKQTDKQTKKNLLTSYLKQATQCKKSRNRKLQTPSTGERPWKIVSPPARQASMAVNSCLLYSTCMCDKLASGACGFCLQRAINYISKCGGIEPCFKPCGPVKRKCDFFNL